MKKLAILAGLSAAISFNATYLWPLGVLSFALFIYLLKKDEETIKISWIYGFIFMGSSILWGFSAFPLSSIGISDPIISAVLLLFIWTLSSLLLALPIALFGYLFVKFKQNSNIDLLFIPALWVLLEILRSLLFFILTLAPQSVIGPHWTFGYSGYILAGSPLLLQLASFGGVYLLGFIFALAGTALAYNYKNKYVLFSFVILSILFYTPINGEIGGETLTIAALKTTESSYFSSGGIDRESRLQRIAELITLASKEDSLDLIVIPEDARFIKLLSEEQLSKVPIRNESFLLGSSRLDTQNEPAKSRVMTYSHTTGKQEHYTKLLLVPESEYLSIFYQLLFTIVGLGERVDNFSNFKEYGRGKKATPTLLGDINVAASLCSEIYSPLIQRDLSKDSGIIINLASHSRLKGSKILFNQIIAMSKVRAVENNKYVVQATNFANSFVISNTGEVVEMTSSDNDFSYSLAEVPIIYKQTIFSKLPYLVPVLSILLILLFRILARREQLEL